MAKRIELLKEYRGLTLKDLSVKITEAQKKITNLEQDKLLGKLKNVHELTAARKSVARLQTILDEKITAEVTND